MSIGSRVRQFLGFIGRSVLWSVHIGLFVYTLFVYYLLGTSASEHWFASMLMISLPLAWLGLLVLGILWLFFRPWRAVLSVVALLAGFWLWPRTFSLNVPDKDTSGKSVLYLLNYNVAGFALDTYYDKQRESLKSKQVTQWVVDHPANVKCFQEFYSGDVSPSFRVRQRLAAAGYRYQATLRPNDFSGVATFSKLPIVAQGRQPFGTSNGLLWTDVAVGDDTVRIINVHLQSMGIRVRKVFETEQMDQAKAETRTVLGALKNGLIARRREVAFIESIIRKSPYPVIVAGDFNDTPYSVVYQHLRRRLRNAFEDAGTGFGFTLNRAPKYIRIDNQFYDPRLRPIRFHTDHDNGHSDHFPVEGEYVVP